MKTIYLCLLLSVPFFSHCSLEERLERKEDRIVGGWYFDKAHFDDLSHIVMDHALLAEGSQLDSPAEYVQRMNKLLLDIDAGAANED